MKLELKHLAPYLPYELKVLFPIYETVHIMTSLNLIYVNREFEYKDILPILKPKTYLHQLQDEMIIRWGDGLSERSKGKWIKAMTDNMLYSDFTSLRYDESQFMIEHHLDVFGLLREGVAIDINTLNK